MNKLPLNVIKDLAERFVLLKRDKKLPQNQQYIFDKLGFHPYNHVHFYFFIQAFGRPTDPAAAQELLDKLSPQKTPRPVDPPNPIAS